MIGAPMAYLLNTAVGHDGQDCLDWPYSKDKKTGRAKVSWKGKMDVAARVVCEILNGPPPSPRHEAAHSCGKGHLGCVSGAHIRWATTQQNASDKIAHGTVPSGEKHSCSILKEDEVLAIHNFLNRGGISQSDIAKKFGIAQTTVSAINRGILWNHVTGRKTHPT